MGMMMNEVISPDMVRVQSPAPDTRSIIQPESSPSGLFGGHFKSLFSPDAFNTLVVDLPTFDIQKSSDASVAIAAILRSEIDYTAG
jgi:hypothetical protein